MFWTFQARSYIPGLYDLHDLYDPAHAAGWEPYVQHAGYKDMFFGLDLYCTTPVQHLSPHVRQVRV